MVVRWRNAVFGHKRVCGSLAYFSYWDNCSNYYLALGLSDCRAQYFTFDNCCFVQHGTFLWRVSLCYDGHANDVRLRYGHDWFLEYYPKTRGWANLGVRNIRWVCGGYVGQRAGSRRYMWHTNNGLACCLTKLGITSPYSVVSGNGSFCSIDDSLVHRSRDRDARVSKLFYHRRAL